MEIEMNVRNNIDINSYYCDWRNCWVAYDTNGEPDDDGVWCGPIAEGRTREEAVTELLAQLEDAQ